MGFFCFFILFASLMIDIFRLPLPFHREGWVESVEYKGIHSIMIPESLFRSSLCDSMMIQFFAHNKLIKSMRNLFSSFFMLFDMLYSRTKGNKPWWYAITWAFLHEVKYLMKNLLFISGAKLKAKIWKMLNKFHVWWWIFEVYELPSTEPSGD